MRIEFDSELRERLDKMRGEWPRIAAKADVSHSWLSQFARDKIPNPGIVTLRKLCDALDALDARQDEAGAA